MLQIQNDQMTVLIDHHGAEMRSLKDNATGLEYLWQADPAYWGRTSPILFPLVGNYKNKETFFDGQSYHLTQHGFARDMDFDLLSKSENEIWFSLTDNEDTKQKYPFSFRLSIGYRLHERTLEVMWKVENTDTRTMYFSIGGHPAFYCPIDPHEKQTDYRIAFDTKSDILYHIVNENGLVSGVTRQLPLKDGMYQITETLFDEDALIIENHQAQEVSLVNPKGEKYVTVTFDAPLFGIWSPVRKNAPFVCIEPWYGRSDRQDFNQKLEEREWGNALKVGDIFSASYRITI